LRGSTLRLIGKPTDGLEPYADYRQTIRACPEGRLIDVRAYCHRHQAEWSEALKRWHEELMEVALAATPQAWLLPGSRIHLWQETIRPFVFALGLMAYFRDRPGTDVAAVGCPPEVGAYVRELSDGDVAVIEDGAGHAGARAVLRKALRPTIEILSALRKLRPVWRFRAPRTNVDLLVVSLGLDGRELRERGDHFFGRELDATGLCTHWLYTVNSPSVRQGVRAALHESGRAFWFDDNLVTWADVVRVVADTVKTRRKLASVSRRLPVIRIGNMVSRLFAQRYFHDEFLQPTPLGELVFHHATSRLLRILSPQAVCYPYEEKGMERALLMACASAPSRPRTIAFAHAAYQCGLLYLKESSRERARPLRPTAIAAPGRGLGQYLAAAFGRADVVVSVGSPRWTSASPGDVRRKDAPLRVLFLTGFGYELLGLAQWIQQCPDLFEHYEAVIRPNPTTHHDEQRAAFALLEGATGITIVHDRPLNEQIDATDVVLFSSTSAVAEAILRGRPAIYVDLNNLWAVDPQQGHAAVDAVKRCATPNELKQTLRGIAAMNSDEFQRLVAAQQIVGERIYMPFDRKRFCELVKGEHPA